MSNNKKDFDYQEFIKKFNNESEPKPKKSVSNKDQTIARCIMIALSLIPLSMMFYKEMSLGFYNTVIIFFIATVLVVFFNQLMSKIFRHKYKDIAEKPMDILFSDKSYGPAILARIIVFAFAFGGALLTAYLSHRTDFWNPVIFFVVGYVFFTMIQFKKM